MKIHEITGDVERLAKKLSRFRPKRPNVDLLQQKASRPADPRGDPGSKGFSIIEPRVKWDDWRSWTDDSRFGELVRDYLLSASRLPD